MAVMRRRPIALVLGTFVLGTIVAACGSTGSSPSTAAALKVGDAAPAFTLPPRTSAAVNRSSSTSAWGLVEADACSR
jgi:hypothetical protein